MSLQSVYWMKELTTHSLFHFSLCIWSKSKRSYCLCKTYTEWKNLRYSKPCLSRFDTPNHNCVSRNSIQQTTCVSRSWYWKILSVSRLEIQQSIWCGAALRMCLLELATSARVPKDSQHRRISLVYAEIASNIHNWPQTIAIVTLLNRIRNWKRKINNC